MRGSAKSNTNVRVGLWIDSRALWDNLFPKLGRLPHRVRAPCYHLAVPHALLDDFEQKQNEHDSQDETEAATAVIPESRSHAITAKTEHQNQNDKNDEHLLSPCANNYFMQV